MGGLGGQRTGQNGQRTWEQNDSISWLGFLLGALALRLAGLARLEQKADIRLPPFPRPVFGRRPALAACAGPVDVSASPVQARLSSNLASRTLNGLEVSISPFFCTGTCQPLGERATRRPSVRRCIVRDPEQGRCRQWPLCVY